MTTSVRPQILYVGRFRLPDCNAAAQRVLANAKGLRLLGYDVVLAEIGHSKGQGGPPQRLPDHEGFTCYRLPMKETSILDHSQLSVRQVKGLLRGMENPRAIIAYNYPAVPLARLGVLCRRLGIRCAADVTEWYGIGQFASGITKALKWIDTEVRMRIIHRRLDALVVISQFLEDFYRRTTGPRVIKVPPLVDARDGKWVRQTANDQFETLRLVYAGATSASKERLDLTVTAVVEAALTIPVHLDVVGVTADQFKALYPGTAPPDPKLVTFHGRVSHQEALAWVAKADYSVILRDRSRLTDAGFPTKFVESITLGTPALVSPHPDLSTLLCNGRNGVVVAGNDLAAELVGCHTSPRIPVERGLFDIRNYETAFVELAGALRLRQ